MPDEKDLEIARLNGEIAALERVINCKPHVATFPQQEAYKPYQPTQPIKPTTNPWFEYIPPYRPSWWEVTYVTRAK